MIKNAKIKDPYEKKMMELVNGARMDARMEDPKTYGNIKLLERIPKKDPFKGASKAHSKAQQDNNSSGHEFSMGKRINEDMEEWKRQQGKTVSPKKQTEVEGGTVLSRLNENGFATDKGVAKNAAEIIHHDDPVIRAERAFEQWITSPDHKRNMIDTTNYAVALSESENGRFHSQLFKPNRLKQVQAQTNLSEEKKKKTKKGKK
ncbi:MAG: hypothetical protein SGCHY_005007 [Lobulomycetales sp.]